MALQNKDDKDTTGKAGGEGAQGEWFLPRDSREYLETLFKDLKATVRFEVFTKDGVNDSYNEAMTRFVADLGRLSDRIQPEFFAIPSDQAAKRQVERSPTLLIAPDAYRIRYTGSPLGEEARTFIEAILLASAGRSGLSKASRDLLAQLEEERTVRVFVNPECPYCPGQAAHAVKAAIERPDLVSAEIVETNENVDLARQHQATALPTTIINDSLRQRGLYPEERFVVELVALKEFGQLQAEREGRAPAPAAAPEPEAVRVDLVVVGAGPAGVTAGIYAERSGLKTVIIEKGMVGGQVALTPEVENYPGFRQVGGIKLMEMMADHARQYCSINEGEEILELKVGKDIEVISSRARYLCRALILATGAQSKFLGAPGEKALYGRGVSVCASCDGWAYKGKEVVMVGGGDSALTEALHLHNIGVKVTLVHRRGEFRAQQRLQANIEKAGIPVVWDSAVEEFLGENGQLVGVRLKNLKTGESRDLKVDGAFIAIGWKPNTELAEQLGVKLDERGYIQVDRHMRTNIPRVYAAGDVTGGLQQIVTAVGGGATAAISVFEDISNPYWKKGG
ncbi:MAG: FAD-dependent oxidoreductase [Thermodesulfobacteriota bacterium]